MNPFLQVSRLVGEKEALRLLQAVYPALGRRTLRQWREMVDGLYVQPVPRGRGYYAVPVLVKQMRAIAPKHNKQ